MLQITFPKDIGVIKESRENYLFNINENDDKYFYNVKKDSNFKNVYSQIKMEGEKHLAHGSMPCFYCGSNGANVIPGFLHDTSGYNLWLYYDWRSSVLMCRDCSGNYSSSGLNYIKRVREVKKGDFNSILSFEPEILVPTLEPVHLHFKYDRDGYLIPRSERAERTISRFALNNDYLVERRYKSTAAFYNVQVRDKYINVGVVNKKTLENLTGSSLSNPVDLLFLPIGCNKITPFLNSLSSCFNKGFKYYRTSFDSKVPFKRVTYKEVWGDAFAVIKFPGLSSLSFNGIRGFSENQLVKFNGKSSLIIVGENGVGKSTFLEVMKRSLKVNYKNHVNDLVDNNISAPATYRVKYNSSNSEFVYLAGRRTGGERESCHVVHVSDSRSSSKGSNKIVNFINKINIEDEVVAWVCKTLADLLGLPNGKKIKYKKKFLYIVDGGNDEISIDCLSSGYNSIINIFGMILSEFDRKGDVNTVRAIYDNMSATVVLADEIELHLHPKFKRNIISSLKSTFPNILFVFTTHDPMVLSSSDQHDIVLLFEKNESDQTHIRADLPDHSELSTQQILSSPIFGLKSFSDENVATLMDEYYSALRVDDKGRSKDLRKKLGKLGYFGQSYRELLAFSAVDAYLSKGLEPDFDNIVSFLERADRND